MADQRRSDGFRVPQNSLEYSMEVSRRYHAIPQSVPVKLSNIAVKKLKEKEKSGLKNVNHNPPSLGHLMNIDTFPFEKKSAVRQKIHKYEKSRRQLPTKESPESSAPGRSPHGPRPIRQTKNELQLDDNKQNFSPLSRGRNPEVSLHKEKVQEEHQKFTKEFKGWQASKLQDRSRYLDQKASIGRWENNQAPAQEYLSKAKRERQRDSRNLDHKKFNEHKGHIPKSTLESIQHRRLGYEGRLNTQWQSSLKQDMASSRNRRQGNKFDQLPLARGNQREKSSYLLETSTESQGVQETHVESSNLIEKKVSTEEFRKEVKERLRLEIEGRGRKASTRTSRFQTSLGERSNDAKQLARDIANHIKRSVSRDLSSVLTKSKSARLYSTKVHINEPDSPEYIRRSARKLLSEKMENVFRIETEAAKTLIDFAMPHSSVLSINRLRSKSEQNSDCSEDKEPTSESITKPYRRERGNNSDGATVPSHGLLRSFSAPTSAIIFGKLLEDDRAVTTAQICMELEASEHTSTAESKNRKTSLNIRGRVSNLRNNFTLRGKLFSNKIHMVREATAFKSDPMKATSTTHPDVVDLVNSLDNSSEVPPSPTSVSSTSLEEFSKQGHASPVSPLDVPFTEDNASPQFLELSLSEIVENSESEQGLNDGQVSFDEIVELEGNMEAYLGDILVTSGLYESTSSDQEIARWDALTKKIPKWVFKIVEEAHSEYLKVDNKSSLMYHQDNTISQRLLFDLVNEALPCIAGTPLTSSKLNSWVVGHKRMPHGRKLLNELWHQIQIYAHSRIDETNSVNSTADRDLKMDPWMSLVHEEFDLTEGQFERVILGELIDEFVRDMVV